jgi:hypothetical protein
MAKRLAEIAIFFPQEAEEYEESLMVHRDLENSIAYLYWHSSAIGAICVF